MTELEKHIVSLLLDNDCVIVPGFGGFMAHRIPASYDKVNGLFIPPSRTIGFNPLLTMNDSLLAQSYANCYDISYPDALRHIESDVDILKRTIEVEGTYNICGIGDIIITADGTYDFQPNNNGFISPEYYGFDTFEMETIKEEATEQQEQGIIDSAKIQANSIFDVNTVKNNTCVESGPIEEEKNERKEISLKIPLRLIQQTAVACIIIVLFMSFPAKIGDSSKSNTLHGAIDTSLLYTIMPKDMTSGKPEKLNSSNKRECATKEFKSDETASIATESTTPKPYYSIVMASRITRKNAEAYIEKLQNKGIKDVRVYTSNGYTKVIYKHFSTQKEAQKALRSLPENSDFKGCWITEVR